MGEDRHGRGRVIRSGDELCWQLGAIVHGSAARYEVLTLDARRAVGLWRTPGQADALLGRGAWGVGRGAWGVGRGAWGVGRGA